MKDTFNSILENAGALLRENAAGAGQAALDTTLQTIEKWLEEFPKLEAYGLRLSNFAFVVGISPALEVELRGEHASFTPERLSTILAENKSTSLVGMVFNAVRTTYRLHAKIARVPDETLTVRLRLSITPEISVFVGRPRVL
ncbi:MAG: hypothetical protein LH618_18955 [Saprospiraceae bacterium]|nr:hypothetical protein [Saprospiraceae bacterium]